MVKPLNDRLLQRVAPRAVLIIAAVADVCVQHRVGADGVGAAAVPAEDRVHAAAALRHDTFQGATRFLLPIPRFDPAC